MQTGKQKGLRKLLELVTSYSSRTETSLSFVFKNLAGQSHFWAYIQKKKTNII